MLHVCAILIFVHKIYYCFHAITSFSHELPEVQATPELESILCNGDLSEPESDEDAGPGMF